MYYILTEMHVCKIIGTLIYQIYMQRYFKNHHSIFSDTYIKFRLDKSSWLLVGASASSWRRLDISSSKLDNFVWLLTFSQAKFWQFSKSKTYRMLKRFQFLEFTLMQLWKILCKEVWEMFNCCERYRVNVDSCSNTLSATVAIS